MQFIEEVFYITANPYGDVISLVFTNNINQSIKGVSKRLKISANNYLVDEHATAVVCNVEEKNYSAIWAIFNVDKFNHGIVVHECLHLTHSILSPRYLKLTDDSEEAYAYLIQWLYNTIIEHYNEFKDGTQKSES